MLSSVSYLEINYRVFKSELDAEKEVEEDVVSCEELVKTLVELKPLPVWETTLSWVDENEEEIVDLFTERGW